MRYLIDTNCCIYLFSGAYPILTERVANTETGMIALSVIVLAELGVGTESGKAPSPEQLDRLCRELPLLSFEPRDAMVYARLAFRRGRFDRLLAAHAVSRGLTLITNNESDFGDIAGLRLENWTLARS